MPTETLDFLQQLESTIRERLESDSASSYTAGLARSGMRRIAQKVGEEGVEVALAAVGDSRQSLCEETADLLYHLLVMLAVSDASLEDVVAVLRQRHVAVD